MINAAGVWKDLSGNGNDVIEHPYRYSDLSKQDSMKRNQLSILPNDILHVHDYPHPFRMNRMTIYVVGNNNLDESQMFGEEASFQSMEKLHHQ